MNLQKYEVKFADNDIHIIDVMATEEELKSEDFNVLESSEIASLMAFREFNDKNPVVIRAVRTTDEMLYS